MVMFFIIYVDLDIIAYKRVLIIMNDILIQSKYIFIIIIVIIINFGSFFERLNKEGL